MAANTGIIKLEIHMDEKGSIKVLQQVGDESDKSGKKGKKAFHDMGASVGEFDKKARSAKDMLLKLGAAVGGLYVLKRGYDALVSSAREWVGLANVQEAAETKVEAVIRATGGAAGYAAQELGAMAAGMQKVTTIGDEVVLGGMSVLLTFKQIREEGFERATKAALDMQAIMGGPLQSAMVMIGKALNDPIANLSAMTRSGVQFTDQQKEMINALWEAGDTVGAQSIILKELESQFGGAAEAAREKFGGAVTAAGNALGDMKEELGFVTTKNQFFIELVHLAEEEFIAWGEQIKNNREYLMGLAKDGVMNVADGIIYAVETLRFFHNGWLGIRLVANAALQGIAWMLEKDIQILRAFLIPLDLIFDGLVKLGKLEANPFDTLENSIGQLRLSSKDVTQNILADIASTNAAYDKVGDTLLGLRARIAEIGVSQAAATETLTAGTNKSLDDIQDKMADLDGTAADLVIGLDDQASAGVDNIIDRMNVLSGSARRAALTTATVGAAGGSSGGISDHPPGALSAYMAAPLGKGLDALEAFGYASGTGLPGLPYTGLFYGHAGEIVMNPAESDRARRGATDNSKKVTIGDINIIVPESAAPAKPQDWRYITRNFIVPELERVIG